MGNLLIAVAYLSLGLVAGIGIGAVLGARAVISDWTKSIKSGVIIINGKVFTTRQVPMFEILKTGSIKGED
jgi:hypothetical protein